jgi:hypothetical protein
MGFRLVATRGTAAKLRAAGLEAHVINKVLEGRPHCVDSIKSGEIQLVINTFGRRAERVRQLRHPPLGADAWRAALHHGGRRARRRRGHCGVESGNT